MIEHCYDQRKDLVEKGEYHSAMGSQRLLIKVLLYPTKSGQEMQKENGNE